MKKQNLLTIWAKRARSIFILAGGCLIFSVFTSCEKPNENEEGGGTTPGGTPTEQFASIQGKVTDKETGEPLSGVTIGIHPTDTYAQTAEDGTYIIENLKVGIYTIRAEKYEYQDYTQENVRLLAGQTTTLDVEMEAEEGMELQIVDEYGESIEELNGGIEESFRIRNEGMKGKWSIEYDADCIAEISPASGTIEAYSDQTITVKKKLLKEDKKTVITIKTKNEDLQLPVAIKGFGEMEVVYVTGGEFEMGATEEQGDDVNEEREKPVRTIRLDSYYIGKYEVTQAQWQAVMGKDLHGLDYKYGKGDDYPAYYVTWEDAQEFCKKLSEATGKKYVLPTEAQWEYAARGGNKSQHYKYAGSNDIDEVAWYDGGEFGTVHPVGQKKANELGIYDMSGNVKEWCSDWYGKYDENDTENPQGPAEGYASQRVMRGGGYGNSDYYCRVSYREGDYPEGSCSSDYGFRVVYLP